MKFFDFGAFQKIMKMLSREKILFHMLFGASHGTSRIQISQVSQNILKASFRRQFVWIPTNYNFILSNQTCILNVQLYKYIGASQFACS